jgi:hypothetical protein
MQLKTRVCFNLGTDVCSLVMEFLKLAPQMFPLRIQLTYAPVVGFRISGADLSANLIDLVIHGPDLPIEDTHCGCDGLCYHRASHDRL